MIVNTKIKNISSGGSKNKGRTVKPIYKVFGAYLKS